MDALCLSFLFVFSLVVTCGLGLRNRSIKDTPPPCRTTPLLCPDSHATEESRRFYELSEGRLEKEVV